MLKSLINPLKGFLFIFSIAHILFYFSKEKMITATKKWIKKLWWFNGDSTRREN